MILSYIRKGKKTISGFFIVLLLSNTLAATKALALTSGPSQPEVQAFEPASTTDMVDLFTGDFTYNIPLFELPGPNGGYPFNLAYHAGITTDQEASWVGLGWSLNPGAITRQMRGLPDEFDGDKVISTKTMKPNKTAGIGAGVGGELFGGDKLQGSVGLSVFHNNYRGVGYSIDGQLGFPLASRGPMTADLGLGFSLSPQEGMRLSPSLGLAVHDKVNNRTVRADVGVGYHSTHGLTDMSYGMSMSKLTGEVYRDKNKEIRRIGSKVPISFSSRLSLFNPGYTPQITMPTIGTNVSLKFSGGAAWWAAYGKLYVSGFFNTEKLKYNGVPREIPAYGYMNYQNADEKSMLDFNREKDGMIRKEVPNLPLPIATNDIYSVTGQGVSGMYRPIRNDVGTLYDPVSESVSNTVSAGIDAGPAASHVGVNLGLFHSKSESGKWSFNNSPYFEGEEENEASEPWYFKVHGEHSSIPYSDYSNIGGDEPVAINLSNTESATLNLSNANKERKPRAQNIQSFTNKQVRNGSSSVLPLLKIGLDRSSTDAYPDHHIAGFITTKDDGMRYVYALPAYNRTQEEMVYQVSKKADWEEVKTSEGFSLDNDKFSSKTVMPSFAHSHLLTGVVGPDYVDVTGNGITQDDLGYWVKFSYDQTTSGSLYEWRTPYSGANYHAGYESDNDDDRGSFLTGTKEIWYLRQAETKTHIVEFHVSNRSDSRSVGSENDISKRLVKIELSAKTENPEENKFISSVHFSHDYSICPGTENSEGNQGKLTLNRLYFKYGQSSRELGAYNFYYQSKNTPYSFKAHDRWGYYKDPNTNWKKDFPYVDQAEAPSYVATWSLNKIDLPSGGSIEVDYESDDYAYVQHKRAMQMMPIISENLKTSGGKIEFKLEKPYEGEASQSEAFIKDEYLDFELDQLYFKARVRLTETANDIVSGYMKVDDSKPMGVSENGQNGYFHVKSMESNYHPISQLAWQHMRVNQPQLVNTLGLSDPNGSVGFFKQLAGAIGGIKDLFTEFNSRADNRGWASSLDAAHSWVRLTSPDKIKYGGGLRVKRILIREGINTEREDVYGHVYNYRMEEGDKEISSGVAAYEPIIGGEENPLRIARNYTQAIKLQSDNNLYFEYPINESHYPGPHVGYRKVTVMSLAAAAKIKDVDGNFVYDPEDNFPDDAGYGSSGKTEYEFYTAYDFPVIGKETPIQKKTKKEISINPLLGVNSIQALTATQGYSILTNDMHGKPKKISYFGQSSYSGGFMAEPYAYTLYEYQHKKIGYDNQLVSVLDNEFKKDSKNPYLVQRVKAGEAVSSNDKYLMGTEYEMIADGRFFNSASFEGGVSVNVDIAYALFFPIVIPTGWPNISEDKSELKTAVTNKVIFHSGILAKTTTFQDGAEVATAYTKWDKLTGRAMLSEITEKFANKRVFTYQVPAYSTYEGMGPAFQNAGLVFSATAVVPVEGKPHEFEMNVQNRVAAKLYPGDEFIFHQLDDDKEVTGKGTAIYLGNASGQHRFFSADSFSGRLTGIVARSGRRNILTADASGFSALKDPSKNSGLGVENYEGQLIVPNND